MALGYTDQAHVEAYLNTVLTEDAKTEMTYLFDYAETYITSRTLQTWYPTATTITSEPYALKIPRIWLKSRPVASITQIQTRSGSVGDTLTTLTSGVDYELFNASKGEVRFVGGYSGRDAYAFVTYVTNNPPPFDIVRATTLIVAHSLMVHLYPDRLGIAEAQAAQGVSVTYNQQTITLHVPDEAREILQNHRAGRVIIA